MSLTFPLALADFADVIGIQTVKWQLNDNRELSGMGTGQILQADLAPSLWSAEVTLRPWRTNDAREIEAKINAVVRSIGSFYLYDPRKAVPKSGSAAHVVGGCAHHTVVSRDGVTTSIIRRWPDVVGEKLRVA